MRIIHMLLDQALKVGLHHLWVNLDGVDGNMDAEFVFNY